MASEGRRKVTSIEWLCHSSLHMLPPGWEGSNLGRTKRGLKKVGSTETSSYPLLRPKASGARTQELAVCTVELDGKHLDDMARPDPIVLWGEMLPHSGHFHTNILHKCPAAWCEDETTEPLEA
mmetsp:Transcript_3812/g.24112  ORF Transcript_3812/g.24112 Transcript_3812/m.24112 type:complete len:123 (+) Transcript_3812:3676-4044(+)